MERRMAYVKFEVYLPEEAVQPIREALNQQGILRMGNYDYVTSLTPVQGSWRPLPGAAPYRGEIGRLEEGSEYKLEFCCPLTLRQLAVQIIRELHPYEEPLIYILPLA